MIFHLTTPSEWAEARNRSEIRAASLESEGFVHCSYRDQVLASADAHFAGHERLIVLEINEAALSDSLRVEQSRGGALFPHVYGPIPLAAVTNEMVLERNTRGRFDWPEPHSGPGSDEQGDAFSR